MQTSLYQSVILKLTNNLFHQLKHEMPALMAHTSVTPEGVTLRTTASKLRPLAFFIRNSSHLQFRTLVDIAVIDKLLPAGRFVVNYLFFSMITNQRIAIQLFASETTTIPSLAAPFANGQRLFASAS
jgi:NADH:ubiquinone oxidoreductase subunit C